MTFTDTGSTDITRPPDTDWHNWGGDTLAYDGCTYEVELEDGTTELAVVTVYDAESVAFYHIPRGQADATDDCLSERGIKRIRWIGA